MCPDPFGVPVIGVEFRSTLVVAIGGQVRMRLSPSDGLRLEIMRIIRNSLMRQFTDRTALAAPGAKPARFRLFQPADTVTAEPALPTLPSVNRQ